ncbi:MAG: hypothetical protein SF172_17710 [Burkholderiales bacterium]|nr:hypothetical protein [Burkholderiales bacterium]
MNSMQQPAGAPGGRGCCRWQGNRACPNAHRRSGCAEQRMRYLTARRLALSLPGVIEAPHHDYNSWRVGKAKRIFVTIPPGETHLHVFVDDAAREQALVLHAAFAEKLLWGGKVVGLRICLDAADAAVVKALIRQAWAQKGGQRGSQPGGKS